MNGFIDMRGQKFGHLLVLEYNKDKRKWLCQCDCKNKTRVYVRGDNLRGGYTKSCGCLKKRKRTNSSNKKCFNDLTGRKFGKLTVLSMTEKRDSSRNIIWKCQCSCSGTIVYVPTRSLTSGRTTSCGCIISKGEEKLGNILKELNILFYKQYVFQDCINPQTKYKLKFDFYLPDYNCCIEYDGEQHFRIRGRTTKEKFYKNKYLDKLKNDYCQEHNIKLIRIPFTDYNILNSEYLNKRLTAQI